MGRFQVTSAQSEENATRLRPIWCAFTELARVVAVQFAVPVKRKRPRLSTTSQQDTGGWWLTCSA